MSKIYLSILACFSAFLAIAGNPDRQGEAGANQLLINPWARSAGLHSSNTSSISGAEALYLNVAGLSRIKKTQIQLGHTIYLQGADISINALGFAQRVGKSGAFGLSLVSFDLGKFDLTTENTPEGSSATFSPNFVNIGLSYSHMFEKVTVGVTGKVVSESISNVTASAFALDAGVQYVTGEKDNFKFGISLRNVGSRMQFRGEGLSKPSNTSGANSYPITYYERSQSYELPSQLNIGASYDFLFGRVNRLTVIGNFTSNAFSRDQVGAAMEFALGQNFALRAGYKYEFDPVAGESTLDNGISGGFSVSVPFKKGSDSRLSIDYGYRATTVFKGIHNIGIRLDL